MENTFREKLLAELTTLSDAPFAAFSSALIPHLSYPLLGVRLPQLRAIARRLAKQEGKLLLSQWEQPVYFEEVMLRGLFLGYLDIPWALRWEEICKFVPLIDNWSVCDSCCATYQQVRAHREEVWPDLMAYLQSNREFEQRFAVVLLMDHFLVDDYLPRVLAAWTAVHPVGYYSEMAIGWGLSVAALHVPATVMELLERPDVALSIRLKACQKILESKRTSAALRAQVVALKKILRKQII